MNVKAKKIALAGVVTTIFNLIFAAVTCGGVFNWVYKIEPTNIWKPMTGGPSVEYMLGLLVMTIVLAFVYAVINKSVPGKNKYIRGLVFGLGVFLVGMLPGMMATREFMVIAPAVIGYWTVLGLVQLPLEGLIIAAIYGE